MWAKRLFGVLITKFILMKQFAILAGAMALLSAPSCFFIDDDNIGNCVNGKGDQVTQVLNIPDFSGITLSIAADVYIEQGAEQKVEVTAQENIIDNIERDVQGNIWNIDFEKCAFDFTDVRITITVPDLESVRISSSGNVFGTGQWNLNLLDLLISGSGDIDMDLDAVSIDATISGSGDMSLTGQTQTLDVLTSGSGDFEGFGLVAQTADLTISGSGDIECQVTDAMDVTISGSGDVFYKGNPTIDVTISGSGELIDAN